ncbi:hypothetical protein BHE74_00037977 [Ensete ventricosum]|nr:hypothetical protein BHE74_00037977 [Ensete ventricosum]
MSQERSTPDNHGEDVSSMMQHTSRVVPQLLPPLPFSGDENPPSHTLGLYWRMFNDLGLTPPPLNLRVLTVTPEAFKGLTNQVQTIVGMLQAIIPYIP